MFRICHVQVSPILGGAQRAMLDMFNELDRARYQIHVVCKEPGPLTQELFRLKIPVHFVPSLDHPTHVWRDYRAYRELRRFFALNQFQIVHTHSAKPGILGRSAARRAGVPIVVHQVRESAVDESSSWPARFLHGQLERRAARYCDCMVFVNREERDAIAAKGWMPAENCITIHGGVDLQVVHPRHRPGQREVYRARWASSEEEFIVLFLGRLDHSKQPLMLAEIAGRLDKLRPRRSWQLLVAGAGPLETQLSQAIKSMQLDHRMRMLGWQDDPQSVLLAADAVLLPSVVESLPRCLIEAQAAGLPIVASEIRGTREIVVEGTGFLCPPKNADCYAVSLARLLDSPELRSTLGQAGRRHAEQCFDTIANNQRIAAIYESLLAS
ncbi:MAG: glycosyltransferase family 4 protein [Planctomycetia bacterium]|nr:glycosyltransferase family 4 protein [Planctomycetia bacterium]